MKFYQAITLLLLFALPLLPAQLDQRVAYAIIIYSLTLLPIFLTSFKEKIAKKDKSTIFFLILLSATTLSTISSIDIGKSAVQLALLFAYFVIFVSIGRVFNSLKSRQQLTLTFLTVTSVLAIVSLYNTAILRIDNLEPVGASFLWVYFGHNHLSALLIFAIPVAIYSLKIHTRDYSRFLYCAICILLLISFYFTFARASQVSFLASLIFAVIIFELIGQKVALFTLAVALAVIGIILANSVVTTQQLGFNKYAALQQNNSRPVYWQQAIENAKIHPLFGTGPDTFGFVNHTAGGKTLKTLYAHNFFLQTLSDSGIFAFIASIALIASVLINAIGNSTRKKEGLAIALTIGLIASTINSLFDFDWQLPAVFLIFWIFAGLFLSAPQTHE